MLGRAEVRRSITVGSSCSAAGALASPMRPDRHLEVIAIAKTSTDASWTEFTRWTDADLWSTRDKL